MGVVCCGGGGVCWNGRRVLHLRVLLPSKHLLEAVRVARPFLLRGAVSKGLPRGKLYIQEL